MLLRSLLGRQTDINARRALIQGGNERQSRQGFAGESLTDRDDSPRASYDQNDIKNGCIDAIRHGTSLRPLACVPPCVHLADYF